MIDTTEKLVKQKGWLFAGCGDVSDIANFINQYGFNSAKPTAKDGSRVVAFNEYGEVSLHEAVEKSHFIFWKKRVWERQDFQTGKKYFTMGSGFSHARAVMSVTGNGVLAMKAAANLDNGTSHTFDVVDFGEKS